MKKKAIFAVIATAAFVGGVTAYTVTKLSNPKPVEIKTTGRIIDASGLGGASSHFTTYSAENYPDLTYAAENAVQAVVGVIKTEEIPQQSYQGGVYPPFLEFFGIPQQQFQQPDEIPRFREQLSGGSGVLISSDGYIVTNHHVVDNASKLTVKLYDGKTYDAKLIGTDADTEIALIKIDATGLPSLPFGSSDALRLGEWVLAIGNPYELHSTVTAGIVSAKSRSLGAIGGMSGLESFIQTDAAVNPGNSGGALVNTRAELVGINTLIKSPTGSYTGYSFAVPETIVRKVVSDLKEFGVVQRALIGVEYSIIDDAFLRFRGDELGIKETGGMYVGGVTAGGGAEAAGIRKGDIITEIDGVKINTSANVAEVISRKRPGDVIKILAKRDGKVKQFEVTLRNKAGKSELIAKDTFDAVKSLGGQFENINLTDKQQKELGIRGGIRVTGIERSGILARARVQKGYIITHINDISINSVNDLYKITEKITSIDGVYPNGRSVSYSLVE